MNYKKIAVILTGFDDVCCRSNGLSNFLILKKIDQEVEFDKCDVYVHPSEFKFLYLYFKFFLKKRTKIVIKKGWKNEKYDMVFSVYSSLISALINNQQDFTLYDPSMPISLIEQNIKCKNLNL